MGDLLLSDIKYRFAFSPTWVISGLQFQYIALFFHSMRDLGLPEMIYRFALSPTWVIPDT